jgi:RecA-family ATPase
VKQIDRDLGAEVAEMAGSHRTDLMIIDTMARVITRDENSADAYRAL